MSRFIGWFSVLVLACARIMAAERVFDFSQAPPNELPKGFRSTVAGKGKPGEWKIISDEVPAAIGPTGVKAATTSKRAVLAQLSGDITDEHFPLLIFDEEVFGDFTFTTRFKAVSGAMEQMAGIVFRYQDENNYYYLRASSLGNTFRFLKVVNGERGAPIGPEIQIPRGVWHEMSVECKGNQIRCSLNGKELIPVLTDASFSSGKIGFWTKSDSVSHFADARISYTPRETLARALIRETMTEFPRLAGLKIYAAKEKKSQPVIIASLNEREVGTLAEQVERDVIQNDTIYFGKSKQTVSVTLPLHDRNGETVAAVRVVMKSFLGQTEQNAIARALPIVKRMELRVQSTKDLLE